MNHDALPSQVDTGRNLFDRLADQVADVTARAWFFAACVALVVIWLPSFVLIGSVDTWQLMINTPTTVVTFLLVGLSQNTSARADAANQQKLNAVSDGVLLLLDVLGYADTEQANELRAAIGIESEESA